LADEDHDRESDDMAGGPLTSVFRVDFHRERDAVTAEAAAVSQAQDVPPGAAALVVTRGPNAGSRCARPGKHVGRTPPR
jgi:hypothetical protein